MNIEETHTEVRDGKSLIPEIVSEVQSAMEQFPPPPFPGNAMTGHERMRLYGAQSRNIGFITTALEIARDHPDYQPGWFSLSDMTQTVRHLNEVRQLTLVLEQFLRLANDELLRTSDRAYHDALHVYRNLQAQTRSRVPGAAELFGKLSEFFARRPRAAAGPSEE